MWSLVWTLLLLVVAAGAHTSSVDVDLTTLLAERGIDVSRFDTLSDCHAACQALSHTYGPNRVLAPNTTLFENVTASYWSAQQAAVQPSCIFFPRLKRDISTVVLLSRRTGCPFAAKSGGHAAFAGASSSPKGITIVFRDLNKVHLNPDKTVASIGPGNTWGDVYRALEPHGLTVVGGRASGIGVGGFTTGGGISFYSNLYGWALDNVHSFEVVIASGAIITASETDHADLYWALRGGGNNLGLVTQFNLFTIPSGTLQGTTRVFAESEVPDVIRAFVHVINSAAGDGNAQHYVAFLHTQGMNIASAELTYVEDLPDPPPIFEPYRVIPALTDTSTARTLVEYADYIQSFSPGGLREIYSTRSVRLNEAFAMWAVNHFYAVLPQVADVAGANPDLIYQAITRPMLQHMTQRGGNTLGLHIEDGPIHILHISFWWADAADDARVYRFVNDYWDAVVARAKTLGLYNEYIYMNYASMFEDPVSGYGETNHARLRQVAEKYDPKQVFQTLQPGYFKLGGHAPVDPARL